MWLLDTINYKLRSFVEQIPEYVILSHTWGAEEVTFNDINKPGVASMAGFAKIVGCCELARRDGYEWAWIDTCCIDKRSSAELSEAINSMYKWYWQAAICYAYLPDVSIHSHTWKQEFEESRWFTRGWTLQELLAPATVEFYNEAWICIGTKARLAQHIQKATKIEPRYFLRRRTIRSASVATKFSWAALRETTRTEDQAYCLLGLFQVNMPMLYGEGERAFYRLQREIMIQTSDHSILAWQTEAWVPEVKAVLAPSPRNFKDSANTRPWISPMKERLTTHEITNIGLRISLPCLSRNEDGLLLVLLNCEPESGSKVGLWLKKRSTGVYERHASYYLGRFDREEEEGAEMTSMYLLMDETRESSYGSSRPALMITSVLCESLRDLHKVASAHWISTAQKFEPAVYGVRSYDGDLINIGLFIKDGTEGGYHAASAVVGLQDGHPSLKFVNDMWARSKDWPQALFFKQKDWEIASDCDQMLGYNSQMIDRRRIIFRMEAKRSRTERLDSTWNVSITMLKCRCGAVQRDGSDCTCSTENRELEQIVGGQSHLHQKLSE